MLENTGSAVEFAGVPANSLSSRYVAAELERQYLEERVAAVIRQMRRERRERAFLYWASFWPIALGVLLGVCAPALHHLAADYAPWAATLLFPLSAVAAQREIHLSLGMTQALVPLMLYAQLPLDGLLARMVLKHRATFLGMCGQVTCFHALAVLYLGLVTGSLKQIFPS